MKAQTPLENSLGNLERELGKYEPNLGKVANLFSFIDAELRYTKDIPMERLLAVERKLKAM